MIYTVTLNPALDHFLDVEDLRLGETNRATGECVYAGGKGIDVSRAIRRLGGDSIALGFIGGHNGRLMVDLLKGEGVTCYFTPIAQETRRNVIICAKRRRTQTMVNAKGPLVAPQEWCAFLTHLGLLDLRGAYVVLGGSLPRGVPQDAYRQIIALVQRQGAKAVLDADGPCFKAGLKARPFAINSRKSCASDSPTQKCRPHACTACPIATRSNCARRVIGWCIESTTASCS